VAHRRVHNEITEGQLHLSLIEYAMRLDHVLAVGSDTLSGFERTLADELVELRAVSDLLEAKAGYLSGKRESLSIEPMLTGMRSMIEHYEAILPERIATADLLQPELEPAALLSRPLDTARVVRAG
jgi:hypothetical protein